DILEKVVENVPPPLGNPKEPLKALIFDSLYDQYRGVIAYICIKEGSVKVGDKIKMMATGKEFEVNEVGIFTPKPVAKDELNVDILEKVVENVPPPLGNPKEPLKALIFDSLYDQYRGVIAYICIKEGSVKVGDKIKMMATGKEFEVNEVGIFTPKPVAKDELN